MIKLLSVIFIVFCLGKVLSVDKKSYGKFKLYILDIRSCKGPKSKDCAVTNVKAIGNHTATFNLEVVDDVVVKKSKIVAMSSGKQLMRLQVANPCQHLFLKHIFSALFKTTENCKVTKGIYTASYNMQDMCDKYFGGAFFYGNFTFKSSFSGDNCNLACINIDILTEPVE